MTPESPTWPRLARTGSCWFVLVRTGLCWLILVCTGSCWFMLVRTGSYWFVLVSRHRGRREVDFLGHFRSFFHPVSAAVLPVPLGTDKRASRSPEISGKRPEPRQPRRFGAESGGFAATRGGQRRWGGLCLLGGNGDFRVPGLIFCSRRPNLERLREAFWPQ